MYYVVAFYVRSDGRERACNRTRDNINGVTRNATRVFSDGTYRSFETTRDNNKTQCLPPLKPLIRSRYDVCTQISPRDGIVVDIGEKKQINNVLRYRFGKIVSPPMEYRKRRKKKRKIRNFFSRNSFQLRVRRHPLRTTYGADAARDAHLYVRRVYYTTASGKVGRQWGEIVCGAKSGWSLNWTVHRYNARDELFFFSQI